MKTIHCDYNPNDGKYYCSTKTKYGLLYPDECEMILDHNDLFDYIKNNKDKYVYELPFLVATDFKKRLESKGE